MTEVKNGGNESKKNGGIEYNRKTTMKYLSRSNHLARRITHVLIRFITKKNVKTPKLSNPTENIGMSANKSSIYESSKVKDPIEI